YVAMSTSNGVSTAALPAPLAPANVSASQATATSLKVSWTDNATDETGFLIAKSTDSLNFDAPITVGASSVLGGVNTGAVSYTFTNLTPNTTYWFKVASQNATGLSAYVLGLNGSATLALTPQLSNASASAESKSRVAVSWQGTAAQYLVTNVTNGTNSGWQTATSYAFAGLTCGTTYTFEIVGKDAQGTLTAPITVSSATQACADLPLVPPLAPALCPTLAPNNLIKVTGAPAIYALDSSLRYRYFADGDVFKSWNMDDGYSGKYISVTPACFNNLSAPAAPPFHVFYRPGSFVVRSAIDAKQLYVVQPGRVLAPITKAAADALYGTAAPKIIGLSEWPYYTKNGSAISGAVPHPGMVVKVSGTIWYITTNLERREVSGEGMSLNRFKQSFVRTVPASSVANYPIGMSIVDYESALSDRLGQ
ncbi:MAG TPA: fibronectin type III domain-containing protein, partial [Patescibacteria group bacterium]|nr:fibronectin type III domain-containing protein [Patescibacteria group bacterium]